MSIFAHKTFGSNSVACPCHEHGEGEEGHNYGAAAKGEAVTGHAFAEQSVQGFYEQSLGAGQEPAWVASYTATSLVVPSTAPAYVKALVGTNPKMWNDAGSGVPTYGQAATVKYTFDATTWAGYPTGTALSGASLTAAQEAMQKWSSVANINFQADTSANAKIIFQLETVGDKGGVARSSFSSTGAFNKVQVVVDTAGGGNNFTAGGYAYSAMLHEVGHAIGLKHPGNYNAGGGGAAGPYLTATEDKLDHSLMSYKAGVYAKGFDGSAPNGPMIYDIAAIQGLYGKNTTYNATDTSYSLSTTSGMHARWDAGGTDSLITAHAGDVTLDLREGIGFITRVGNSATWNAFGANIENASGSTGNDTIIGNALANMLLGGGGNDTITGGAGNDTMSGSTGNDTFVVLSAGEGTDVILDSDAGDVLKIDGKVVAGNATNLGAGNYSLIVTGLTLNIALSGSTLTITNVKTGGTVVQISNFTSGDFGINLGAIGTITGDANANSLKGTLGAETISGGDGNDTLDGGLNGADVVNGGNGNDMITTTGANAVLNGDAGNDTITAKGANSTVNGGDGDDKITASVTGGVANGDAGNDTITVTGTGTLTVAGGAGNDIIGFAASGNVNGGDDNDAITITGTNVTVDGGNGNDTLTASFSKAGSNSVAGGAGDDVVNATASTFGVVIDGGTGNDNITGGKGADSITGGAGFDFIAGGLGGDIINLGSDSTADEVHFLTVGDGAAKGAVTGYDEITGFDATGDVITFASTIWTMWDDLGLKGSLDYATDAAANFVVNHEAWIVTGATDASLTQTGFTALTTQLNALGVTSSAGSDALIIVQGATKTGLYSYTETTTNNNIAGAELQLLAVVNGSVNIADTGGNKTIANTTGNRTVEAGIGNDVVTNSAINVRLNGGIGNDKLTTSSTGSTIDGGAGNDNITGSTNVDTLIGGTGADIITGGKGADVIQLGTDGFADDVLYTALTDGATVAGANTGYDVITGFESGVDDIVFGTALKTMWDDVGVANGALAFTTNGAANFGTTNEAWLVTGLSDAALTQSGYSTLLTQLNTLGVTAAKAADGLIAVQGATQTAFYAYLENGTLANNVSANELTLIGLVNGAAGTGDFSL